MLGSMIVINFQGTFVATHDAPDNKEAAQFSSSKQRFIRNDG